MNVEIIRTRLSTQLRQHFPALSEVSVTVVSPVNLMGPLLKSAIVYSFEFIIDNRERYTTFAMESGNGEVYFTRPKEGIRKELAIMIRNRDFCLQLSEDILNHQDLVGKFVENKLNHNARGMVDSLSEYLKESISDELSEEVHICHGFKITRYHKQAMTCDLVVEVLAKLKSQTRFKRFNVEMIGGKINRVSDSNNNLVSIAGSLRGE